MGAVYDDSDMSGLALPLSIFRIPIDRILPISHLSVKVPKHFRNPHRPMRVITT